MRHNADARIRHKALEARRASQARRHGRWPAAGPKYCTWAVARRRWHACAAGWPQASASVWTQWQCSVLVRVETGEAFRHLP